MIDKSELRGATGYKVRMRFLKWWLRLYKELEKDKWLEVGEFGPFDNTPFIEGSALSHAIDELKTHGLVDIERELGSRGK